MKAPTKSTGEDSQIAGNRVDVHSPMKVPTKGKEIVIRDFHTHAALTASMKALPKRKRNSRLRVQPVASPMSLNESLHLKVQNKRSRGYPGDIDLSY